TMRGLYFAYGSNMCSARLAERVPDARAVGPAQLPDHRLVLNKPGVDGSAKANVEPQPGAVVWGVTYEVPVSDLARLDRYEVGYRRLPMRVYGAAEATIDAEIYVAVRTTRDIVPFDWYKRLLLAGAREHGLPVSYVEALRALPARSAAREAGEAS
ncbi:MAG: gamma-glutamylcyclotransferase, partial [Deltaproteobacteria bacterium]